MRLVADELLMVAALVAWPETMVSSFLDRSSMEVLMFWVPSRAGELGHLGHELLVVLGRQGILVAHLGHQQLQEILLAQLLGPVLEDLLIARVGHVGSDVAFRTGRRSRPGPSPWRG